MPETITPQDAARRTVMNCLFGATATQAVGVAVKLGIAETIGAGTATVTDIAAAHDIPADRMVRLLRALGGLGLCVEPEPGSFALTEAGALLRGAHAESLRDLARLLTDPATQTVWSQMESSLRTGRTAFEEAFDKPVFDFLTSEPELYAAFNSSQGQNSRRFAAALPEHYDFGQFSSVTDVGGGDGTLLTAILASRPALSGVVFDTPDGAAQASETIAKAGVGERATVVTGDFFTEVPAGSDLYLLKNVLHDWPDEHATTILRRCAEALSPEGRVLIIDHLLPESVGADAVDPNAVENPFLSDLNMLMVAGGRERTRTELDRMCHAAKLRVHRVIPMPAHLGLCLVEATPA